MIRGLYSAASALETAQKQQEITAHNVAHASTPGYRQRGMGYETFAQALSARTGHPVELAGTTIGTNYHDFRSGPLQRTGNPLDLAIKGDQFFTLNTPGGVVYTRNGSFTLDESGQITSDAGYTLQGTNGPLTVPPGGGTIVVSGDGRVSVDGQPIGQIQFTRFRRPDQLVAAGPTLFNAPDTAELETGTGEVIQGSLEGANIQPAAAMVELIQTSRFFEAAQRVLRTIAETVQLNTQPRG